MSSIYPQNTDLDWLLDEANINELYNILNGVQHPMAEAYKRHFCGFEQVANTSPQTMYIRMRMHLEKKATPHATLECWYGTKCNKALCTLPHPEEAFSASVPATKQAVLPKLNPNHICKYGINCTNTKCSKQHPCRKTECTDTLRCGLEHIVCKFNKKCSNGTCRYKHTKELKPFRSEAIAMVTTKDGSRVKKGQFRNPIWLQPGSKYTSKYDRETGLLTITMNGKSIIINTAKNVSRDKILAEITAAFGKECEWHQLAEAYLLDSACNRHGLNIPISMGDDAVTQTIAHYLVYAIPDLFTNAKCILYMLRPEMITLQDEYQIKWKQHISKKQVPNPVELWKWLAGRLVWWINPHTNMIEFSVVADTHMMDVHPLEGELVSTWALCDDGEYHVLMLPYEKDNNQYYDAMSFGMNDITRELGDIKSENGFFDCVETNVPW